MKRSVLAVVLGITFLIGMTWLGTILTSIVPRQASAQVQNAQVGAYQISLRVDPNPPLITQPAKISIQVLLNSSQLPVTNAQVALESNMETMDMGTDHADASFQGSTHLYIASVQFAMSGPWQVRVIVTIPGSAPFSAIFEITAQ